MQKGEGKSVGIVGGGFLGMTLALLLAERGWSPVIFEKDENLGGLAGSCKIGPYRWDKFYHVILKSDKNVLGLLDEMGLADHVHWEKARSCFWAEGNFFSLSNISEFIRFPLLGFADKVRLGWNVFYASRIKSGKNLEGLSVKEWLMRHSGPRTFNKIWSPLLKSKLGEGCERVNASFIWATIARMYAARGNGSKTETFGYIKGGYGTVIDRFGQFLGEKGVKVISPAEVREVSNQSGGVEVKTAGGRIFRFNRVILTIPSTMVPRICPGLSEEEKKRLGAVNYQGVISLVVMLRKPLGGFYITNITEEGFPFTTVIEMTALVDPGTFGGNSLVYLPKYIPQDDPMWEKSDEDIQAEFMEALQKMYPHISIEDVSASMVIRVREVFPVPTINYPQELLPAVRTSIPNVFVVNSSQIPNGITNINEIVGLANQKMKELVQLV